MGVKVTGLRAIDKRFEALTGPKQRTYLRQGARAAGSALIKETKRRVPDRKTRDEKGKLGGLKRSMFQVPSSKWKNAGAMRAQGVVGSRVGFRKRGGAHAHLVEYGHRVVRNGKVVGFAPPYPFMRPAMVAAEMAMKRAYRQKIIAGIRKNTR